MVRVSESKNTCCVCLEKGQRITGFMSHELERRISRITNDNQAANCTLPTLCVRTLCHKSFDNPLCPPEAHRGRTALNFFDPTLMGNQATKSSAKNNNNNSQSTMRRTRSDPKIVQQVELQLPMFPLQTPFCRYRVSKPCNIFSDSHRALSKFTIHFLPMRCKSQHQLHTPCFTPTSRLHTRSSISQHNTTLDTCTYTHTTPHTHTPHTHTPTHPQHFHSFSQGVRKGLGEQSRWTHRLYWVRFSSC